MHKFDGNSGFGYDMAGERKKEKIEDSLINYDLRPHIQIWLGKFGACSAIIYGFYLIIIHKFYMVVITPPPNMLFMLFLFFTLDFVIPGIYVYGLTYGKINITKLSYGVWLAFVVIYFLFEGFCKLILMGDFSEFATFWAPLGIITIFWRVGLRGLDRVTKPETEKKNLDDVSNISMYIGVFLGFFCGGKITHDLLASYWPDMPHYDKLRWVLPCFGGAIAGSFVGAYIGAFIGYFVNKALIKSSTQEKMTGE